MTVKIGYAAMLEQFHPSEALALCAIAEANGFDGVMASDHLQPWVPQQGQSAFVWSFMAAAAERTKGDIGPGVTCPSFRTHPVIIAQAAATMAASVRGSGAQASTDPATNVKRRSSMASVTTASLRRSRPSLK